MADIKKFLDQSGVSTLWTQVANKVSTAVNDEKTRAMEAEADLLAKINAEASRADAAEKAAVAAAGTAKSAADAAAATANANATAIATLQGSDTTMSARAIAAAEVAKIVAGAGASYDTLKEIADWISSHAGSASEMNTAIGNNADAIDDLEELVGSKAVATQIAEAIDAQDLSKYALAADLTTLSQTYNAFAAKGVRPITQAEIDKLAKLALTDGNLTISGSVAAGNVQGLTDAIDDQIDSRIVAMTATEIQNACK